jgi:hypothetical protein
MKIASPSTTDESMAGATLLEVHSTGPGGESGALGLGLVVNRNEHAESVDAKTGAAEHRSNCRQGLILAIRLMAPAEPQAAERTARDSRWSRQLIVERDRPLG